MDLGVMRGGEGRGVWSDLKILWLAFYARFVFSRLCI